MGKELKMHSWKVLRNHYTMEYAQVNKDIVKFV